MKHEAKMIRDSLIHININGCQSINKSAIDALLRLTHRHLPKLQRIHMEGLRLELCQQAAKSFLREKLNMLDSLGTMGAFTLGQRGEAVQNGATGVYMNGQDLTATHLTHWLQEYSRESRTRVHQATTIANLHPRGLQGPRQPNNPERRVPFHHSTNLINMPQVGMFRNEDGTLRTPQWNRTLSGTPLVPELDSNDPEAGLPQIFTP